MNLSNCLKVLASALVFAAQAEAQFSAAGQGDGYEVQDGDEGLSPEQLERNFFKGVEVEFTHRNNRCNVDERAKWKDYFVGFEYKAYGEDGRFLIDSEPGETIYTRIGAGASLDGLERGLIGVCPGESLTVKVPAHLGFESKDIMTNKKHSYVKAVVERNGRDKWPVTTSGETVTFKVEVVEVDHKTVVFKRHQDHEDMMKLFERKVVSGDKECSMPAQHSIHQVTYTYEIRGFNNRLIFANNNRPGEKTILGSLTTLPGLEMGLKGACPGQTLLIHVPEGLGFKSEAILEQRNSKNVSPFLQAVGDLQYKVRAGEVFQITVFVHNVVDLATAEAQKGTEIEVVTMKASQSGCKDVVGDLDELKMYSVASFTEGDKVNQEFENVDTAKNVTATIAFMLPGLYDGLFGMCEGEIRTIDIPSSLAFGFDFKGNGMGKHPAATFDFSKVPFTKKARIHYKVQLVTIYKKEAIEAARAADLAAAHEVIEQAKNPKVEAPEPKAKEAVKETGEEKDLLLQLAEFATSPLNTMIAGGSVLLILVMLAAAPKETADAPKEAKAKSAKSPKNEAKKGK